MEMDNNQRCERAEKALAEYDNGDLECDMNDLFTDLRHLCAREGIDFYARITTSSMHFEAEVEEESHG